MVGNTEKILSFVFSRLLENASNRPGSVWKYYICYIQSLFFNTRIKKTNLQQIEFQNSIKEFLWRYNRHKKVLENIPETQNDYSPTLETWSPPTLGNPISCSPLVAPNIFSIRVKYFAIPLITEWLRVCSLSRIFPMYLLVCLTRDCINCIAVTVSTESRK